MKRNDLRALRELTMADLEQRARETKEELFNLRFALRTGTSERFLARQARPPHLRPDSDRDLREANRRHSTSSG